MTRGYRGQQSVTVGDTGLQRVTGDDKGLHRGTGRFKSSLCTILKFKSHHQAQHQVGHCYQTKET